MEEPKVKIKILGDPKGDEKRKKAPDPGVWVRGTRCKPGAEVHCSKRDADLLIHQGKAELVKPPKQAES